MKGAAAYVVRWRPTNAANWEKSLRLAAGDPELCRKLSAEGQTLPEIRCDHVLERVRVDDWIFGVSSVSADGYESPIASAVPGGAFRPYAPPPPAQP